MLGCDADEVSFAHGASEAWWRAFTAFPLAAGDRVVMLEHSVYSVISPEGCASILWRSRDYSEQAAEALKLTAQDLIKLGVVDEVVPEPLGGAHRDGATTIEAVGDKLEQALTDLLPAGSDLRTKRREKFLAMGKKGLA